MFCLSHTYRTIFSFLNEWNTIIGTLLCSGWMLHYSLNYEQFLSIVSDSAWICLWHLQTIKTFHCVTLRLTYRNMTASFQIFLQKQALDSGGTLFQSNQFLFIIQVLGVSYQNTFKKHQWSRNLILLVLYTRPRFDPLLVIPRSPVRKDDAFFFHSADAGTSPAEGMSYRLPSGGVSKLKLVKPMLAFPKVVMQRPTTPANAQSVAITLPTLARMSGCQK